LIFDVCRKGNNGHNPVPIAIVDGRVGLPTAFRLGAELDPDQTRLRKDQGPKYDPHRGQPGAKRRPRHTRCVSVQPASAVSAVEASVVNTEVRAMAAGGGFFARLAPAVTTTMHSAVEEAEEIDAAPANAEFGKCVGILWDIWDIDVVRRSSASRTEEQRKWKWKRNRRRHSRKSLEPAKASSRNRRQNPAPLRTSASTTSTASERRAGRITLALVMAGGGFYGAWLVSARISGRGATADLIAC